MLAFALEAESLTYERAVGHEPGGLLHEYLLSVSFLPHTVAAHVPFVNVDVLLP